MFNDSTSENSDPDSEMMDIENTFSHLTNSKGVVTKQGVVRFLEMNNEISKRSYNDFNNMHRNEDEQGKIQYAWDVAMKFKYGKEFSAEEAYEKD